MRPEGLGIALGPGQQNGAGHGGRTAVAGHQVADDPGRIPAEAIEDATPQWHQGRLWR